MLPYILLTFVPGLFVLFAVAKNEDGMRVLSIEKKRIAVHNLCIPVFFIMLFLVLALRSERVGVDLASYKYYWERYTHMSLARLMTLEQEIDVEPLYRLLNYAVGRFSGSFQVFLAVVAALEVLPVALLYQEDRRFSYLKVVLFLNMTTFVMMFSGLRQALAIALGTVVYFFVRRKQWVFFIVTVLAAMLIHHSAFMLFLLYPLYWIRLKKGHLYFIIPAMAALFVFRSWIFNWLATLFRDYSAEISQSNAFATLALFAAFTVMAFLLPDEETMDAEAFGLRNYLLMATALQMFASLNALAMRMNYYFIIFVPLAVARVLCFPKRKYQQIAVVANVVIVVFMMCYFLVTTYSAYIADGNLMKTIPYIPFWKDGC